MTSCAHSDGYAAGCPGASVRESRNTDRRAHGNKVRPTGQGPSARLLYGFTSHGRPTSQAARSHPPTPPPAPQHDTQPARGSEPQPDAAGTLAISACATIHSDEPAFMTGQVSSFQAVICSWLRSAAWRAGTCTLQPAR